MTSQATFCTFHCGDGFGSGQPSMIKRLPGQPSMIKRSPPNNPCVPVDTGCHSLTLTLSGLFNRSCCLLSPLLTGWVSRHSKKCLRCHRTQSSDSMPTGLGPSAEDQGASQQPTKPLAQIAQFVLVSKKNLPIAGRRPYSILRPCCQKPLWSTKEAICQERN